MFQTISNSHLNVFDQFCGEVKKDVERIHYSTDDKVRGVALIKLALLVGLGINILRTFTTISILLQGAIAAAAIHITVIAFSTLLLRDAYIILKNSQAPISTIAFTGINLAYQTGKSLKNGNGLDFSNSIEKAHYAATVRGTFFEKQYIALHKFLKLEKHSKI